MVRSSRGCTAPLASTPLVTLSLRAPPSDGTTPWQLGIQSKSGFMTSSNWVRFPVVAGAVLPPWGDVVAPTHMGMACDTGIVAVVADKNATGWSSVDARWKWNTTLASPSVDAEDAGADTPAGSDYAGGCTALSAKNGAVALKLANGKHVTLSLRDGKIH